MPEQKNAWAIHAETIGAVSAQARRLLAAVDLMPPEQRNAGFYEDATTALEALLRELMYAITAITTDARRTPPTSFAAAQQAFATRGTSHGTLTEEGRQRVEGWLVASAIGLTVDRKGLATLATASGRDFIPGLDEVIGAFPDHYSDLEQFEVLRTPAKELDGYSPIRWLLTGRDIPTVVCVIDELGPQ